MPTLDIWVATSLNALVGRSWAFDTWLLYCANNEVLKAWPVAVYFWLWFRSSEQARRDQRLLLSGVIMAVGSVLLARALADCLPYRVRPVNNPALHLHIAEGFHGAGAYADWSSFPSDHAVIYAVLAGVLFALARPIGTATVAYVVFVIDLPRVFLGIHYPSDILAGTALGLAVAVLGTTERISRIGEPLLRFRDRSPGWFYAALSFALFSIPMVFHWMQLLRFSATLVHAGLRRVVGV